MAILQNGMSVQCRTSIERDLFYEVARREGWRWNGSDDMRPMTLRVPTSFQLGYSHDGRVTHGYADRVYGTLKNVEASKLFHNLLISRRAKNGNY